MQTVEDLRSCKDSLVSKNSQKEPSSIFEGKSELSIHNNSNHPILRNIAEVKTLVDARASLENACHYLRESFHHLAQMPIELREIKNAYAFASAYIHVIDTTLDIPQNARLEKMLEQREAEILAMFKSSANTKKGGVI